MLYLREVTSLTPDYRLATYPVVHRPIRLDIIPSRIILARGDLPHPRLAICILLSIALSVRL